MAYRAPLPGGNQVALLDSVGNRVVYNMCRNLEWQVCSVFEARIQPPVCMTIVTSIGRTNSTYDEVVVIPTLIVIELLEM